MKFLNQTLLETRDQIATGKTKSTDVVAEALARVQKHDKKLNSFVTMNEQALKHAEEIDQKIKRGEKAGRLAGIPLAVKDMFCTKGIRTTASSKILSNFIPQYSATVVERLEKEGAVIIGKTNCDEFAMGSSNEHSFFGPVQNPWREGHVPGGSSGGAAAAQAAGFCFGSMGTDTGGSIRQPASLCGLYGIKPTYGRVSRYGIVSYASSDQAGPFASTTRDAAEVLTSISGYDDRDSTTSQEAVPDFAKNISTDVSKLTIGLPKEYFGADLNPEIKAATMNAVEALKAKGAKVKEVSLPHTKFAVPVYYLVATSEASSNLSRYDGIRYGLRVNSMDLNELYSKTRAEGFGAEVKKRIMLGTFALSSGYYDAYYKKASQVRHLILKDFQKIFTECDVIMCPVTTSTAFKIGERVRDTISMYYNDIFTTSVNLAGLPGMSIPAGQSKDGLPIGVQVIAPHFKEQTIFNVSQTLEDQLKLTKGFQMAYSDYESVIGLEIHAQFLTNSKLFCRCSAHYGGGDNEHTCPVCTGMPGALPVMNERVAEFAVKTGLALNCQINQKSTFSRKNYFYPDLPKGYQISQFDEPICGNGHVEFIINGERKRVGITRAHIEEDAGKSTHHGEYSLVNYNRSSVPLLEIVSEPDMRTPQEAAEYARIVRSILRYLGVCDGNLEEGSMRCDCNVSVRKKGEKKLGTRTELKNINSFRFIEKAIQYEIERQVDSIEAGQPIVQETRLYDSTKNKTFSMRSKEEAHDYRYFPEPDLVPLKFDLAFIEKIKSNLPELPIHRAQRFLNDYGLPEYDCQILTVEKEMADYFEEVAKSSGGNAKAASNWIMGELLRELNNSKKEIADCPIKPALLGEMITMIDKNVISGKIAKTVFAEMFATGKSPKDIVASQGLTQITDTGAIEKIIDEVMAASPGQLAEYRSGKEKLFGFFVGQAMKASKGQANPEALNELLKKKLKA